MRGEISLPLNMSTLVALQASKLQRNNFKGQTERNVFAFRKENGPYNAFSTLARQVGNTILYYT